MLRPLCRQATKRLGGAVRPAVLGKRYLHAPVQFDWKDPLNAASLLTEEEQAISETAEAYCQERMLPRVLGNAAISHAAISTDIHSQRHTEMRNSTGRLSKRWVNWVCSVHPSRATNVLA